MEYLIKSTISFVFTYVFYYILLRNIKTFKFNRFYLLFALVFSITIPFIHVNTTFEININRKIEEISASTGSLFFEDEVAGKKDLKIFTNSNIILFIYVIISFIFFIRLLRNFVKILKKIKTSVRIDNFGLVIVLVKEKIIPYSFFRHIFINEQTFKKYGFDNELVIHEKIHCIQYHSADILFIELLKVFYWFNPVIWLFKSAIQLNHEYLADHEVIKKYNRETYQNLILNHLFMSNSIYLSSQLNNSLTKKRLIMMSKNNSSLRSMVSEIAIIPLVMILSITLSFSQIPEDSTLSFENEWWLPILQKHGKELLAFNNFENIFEMGEKNSINDGICTLVNAFLIVRDSLDNYLIIESPLVYHDFNNEKIKIKAGTVSKYKKDSDPYRPIERYTVDKMELSVNRNK